jgi:SAM-dependent methyltransferase
MKKFYFADIYEEVYKLWSAKKSFPYPLDGVIFTPINEPYINKNIYKWKSEDKSTIDFAIKKQIIKKKGDEHTSSTKVTWKLMIAGYNKNNTYTHIGFEGNDSKRTFIHRYNGTNPVTEILAIPKSLGTIELSMQKSGKYPDGSVIEFEFSKGMFNPVRVREDKLHANGVLATNDAWNLIKHPLTKNDIKNGPYVFCGRKFHNVIKNKLIKDNMTKKSVLDIGSGAGGDITKYVQHKISRVVGIDIVDVEYAHPKTMKFFKTTEELYNIKQILKNELSSTFDVINCQFAVHYFFKNKQTLENFVHNVDNCLSKKGSLVITCLDGYKVVKSLDKTGKYISPIVQIVTNPNVVKTTKLVGQNISVALKGTKYFKNVASKEFIVYPKLFVEFMLEHGFVLESSTPFVDFCTTFPNECSYMNKYEKEFSFLNTTMIFTRQSHL